jgi:hypothetical protein
MDTKRILADLRAEYDRIDRAIAAFEALGADAVAVTPRQGIKPQPQPAPTKTRGRRLIPAGRRRLSAMMKARWAARRKAAAKPAPKRRRTMSTAARKKIAEAQRKRWAARKAAAKKE